MRVRLVLLISLFVLVIGSSMACSERKIGVKTDFEGLFKEAGLVDLQQVAPKIRVDIVNSDPRKNYFRRDFYGNLKKCYLHSEVALKLKLAQTLLDRKKTGYYLLVLDGTRPRRVQSQMYQVLQNSPFKNYVADPRSGSMHNYGAAVDITIINKQGKELDMGPTPFRKNNLQLVKMLLQQKLKLKLSANQKLNRELLKQVMIQAGLHPIELEWWHFEGFSKEEIRRRYQIID